MLLLHDTCNACAFLLASNYGLQESGRGWMEKRKEERKGGWGRGGDYIQNRQLYALLYGWAALLFQSVRYFNPHQLVLRRWQLVQFGASRWPIVRAFSPMSCPSLAYADAPCRQIMWSDHVDIDDLVNILYSRSVSTNCDPLDRSDAIIAPTLKIHLRRPLHPSFPSREESCTVISP